MINKHVGIPVIPMRRILIQWAAARNIPFNPKSWESIVRCFNAYNLQAKIQN